ncbi:uncharacterized protein LOC18436043 [Amborella trichopoda]|nr:uncharacterized protein LOC18436043 [Amborella trichopoda]|eukprot:XP_006846134.2 uncharacterized protein LOC18436043 [Amborella trichopoda]
MGSLSPEFAYAVVYVKDVAKYVAFYIRAFGCKVRTLHESHRLHSLECLVSSQGKERYICIVTDYRRWRCDVSKRAIEPGARPVREPEEKEWGQKVGYVRDMDGIVVRLGSKRLQSRPLDYSNP